MNQRLQTNVANSCVWSKKKYSNFSVDDMLMNLYFTVIILQNQQITPILQKQTYLIMNILLSSDRKESYKTNVFDSLII